MSDPRTRIAVILLAAVTALIGWWGWKQGAYFGTVFYPGAFAIFALLAMLLASAPFEGRLRGPARVALAALIALAVWIAVSALWSPAPALAVSYAAHAFLYAALFGLGIWVTHLLGERYSVLSLTPLAIAGTLIAIATVIVLATGSNVTWYLHEDATLRFPIGYRNANAAFFMICVWAVLALAAEPRWRWWLRALAVASGSVMIELTILSQSRGSIPAVALAALVYLVIASDRLRAAVVLGLMVLPVLPALPALLDVFRHGSADAAVIPLLRSSAKAIAATGVLSLILAAVAIGVLSPRLRLRAATVRAISWVAAISAALIVIVGGAAFVARHGGPLGFVDQRVQEFDQVGYPDLHGQGVRYGANIGSNRHDFWRVAIDEGIHHPLLGGGAGSFQSVYLRHRLSEESPEDPHSVEALMFSELGLPGIALLFAFLIASVLAGWRSRRVGPTATALVAGALAGGTQWFVQASFDWIWNYPGITAPAMFILGAAAAPALREAGAGWGGRWRVSAAVVLVALALLVVAPFLSGRYSQRAFEEAGADPQAAIADFGSAADLNPLDGGPLLARGVILSRQGERGLALASFRQAAAREPENFAPYLYIAGQLFGNSPRAAAVALERARRLDPKDPSVASLRQRLEKQRSR